MCVHVCVKMWQGKGGLVREGAFAPGRGSQGISADYETKEPGYKTKGSFPVRRTHRGSGTPQAEKSAGEV